MGFINYATTTHFQISYDDTFSAANGLDVAAQFWADCESDFELMSGWFSGVNFKFNFPIPVQIANASGGASWQDPSDTQVFFGTSPTITVNPVTATGVSALFVRYLVVSEMTEMFMASQGTGWFESTSVFSGADEGSKGEGLSRFLGAQFLAANNEGIVPPQGFQVLPSWLNSPRANFVDNNPDDHNPDATTGCTTCFIYYLHDQLGFSTNAIIAAGAPTLASVYTNLTGKTDAWSAFSGLVNLHYPPIDPVRGPITYHPLTDSLFPVPDLADIISGVQLMSGSTISTPILDLNGTVSAEVTIQLTSHEPAVLSLPPSVTLLPANPGSWDVQLQAQPVTGPPISAPVQATYAGKTVQGSITVTPRPSVISGRVTDTALQPIKDAFVVFSAAEPITSTTGDSLQLSTDANGQYQTPDIPPQLYQVQAGQDGFVTGQASVTVGLGVPVTTQNFALTAIEPVTVKGTVSSQTGAPLKGATVTLDIGAHATTGPGGSYQFTEPGSPNPGDFHLLTASLAGFMSSTVTITIPNGATVTQNIVLEQLGSLSGTVISAVGGAPVSGATVTAGAASGTSGPAGAYSLPSLDPGATNVTATAPGFDPAQTQVSIPPGTHVVHDITMAPASATLTGTVISQDDGLPVPATVAIPEVGTVHTDATGSYTFPHVPAGGHTVMASADRFKSQTVSIQVTAHQTLRQNFVLFLLHQPKPTGDLPKN
jgi:Carboxypeptidase regulatory-like domain